MTFNYPLGGIINPLGQALKWESISFISNCLDPHHGLCSGTGLILQVRTRGYWTVALRSHSTATFHVLGLGTQTTSDRNYKTQTDKKPTLHLH